MSVPCIGGERILLVDDDDVFRRGLARMLTNAGYECQEASSAFEAREQLVAADDIAAILCDVRMPGGSGLDLLKEVSVDHPDVAVVMVTGVDDRATALEAFEIGAYGYLTKPFGPNEVLVNLAGALTRRQLEQSQRHYVHGLERTIERLRSLQGTLEALESAEGVDGETMGRLSRALSLRDEETGRHIERMSRYAALLAEATDADLDGEQLRMVTALHDVGKIGVPDSILLKPGALTSEESVAMQRHARIGYQLLAGASSPLVRRAADVAYCHHEWWDGTGYPRGLEREEIPVEARIAAVTDVFDALTSDRVYRRGLPIDEALAVMAGLRGRQFEPRLLDSFVEALPDVSAIRAAWPERSDDARIRVLIVDDHTMFVESLARLLGASPDVTVVGRAASVAEAVEATRTYTPDVVLMDFELPDGTGAEATIRIRSLVPGAKVIMLTGRMDEQARAHSIAAGCAGFLTKTEASDVVVQTIRAAHEGETIGSIPDLASALGRLPPTRRGLGAALGRREVEVLGLVAEGLSNKDIARRLSLSLNTVRNHVQNVLYKLDAHSKLEAVATASREGVIAVRRAAATPGT